MPPSWGNVYGVNTMIDKDKIDSVFSIALPEMNPENRDSWTHRYGIYKHPKTVFTGPLASMMEGRQNQLLNYIERVAELALTESNGHPDKSSWKTELEESIPALEKAVQHNEEQTKGRFPTGHESNSLRDARQALSDARFLLAYASGLLSLKKQKADIQKAKKATKQIRYMGNELNVKEALDELQQKGFIEQKDNYICPRRGVLSNTKEFPYSDCVSPQGVIIEGIKNIIEKHGLDVTEFLSKSEIDFRNNSGKTIIKTATALYELWNKH